MKCTMRKESSLRNHQALVFRINPVGWAKCWSSCLCHQVLTHFRLLLCASHPFWAEVAFRKRWRRLQTTSRQYSHFVIHHSMSPLPSLQLINFTSILKVYLTYWNVCVNDHSFIIGKVKEKLFAKALHCHSKDIFTLSFFQGAEGGLNGSLLIPLSHNSPVRQVWLKEPRVTHWTLWQSSNRIPGLPSPSLTF